MTEGEYEVQLYYTCPEEDVGSTIQLSFKNSKLEYELTDAFESELLTDDDVYPRMEGYVKEFKRVTLGRIQFDKGVGTLSLKASDIPGSQVMDFRLLMLKHP